MTVIITTSWDDGHVLDLRVADLLDRYGLTGTFYIAKDFLPERMTDAQLRDLSTRHEIGAHTLTHPVLTEVSLEQAREEIHGSKIWLEDILGQEVTAFCYPRGANNADLQNIVREAGYTIARTVAKFRITTGDNPFAIPTTLQIYPYPLRPLPDIKIWRGWGTRLQPLREAIPLIRRFKLAPANLWDAQSLAQSLLQIAEKENGIWHLWGHSWEVDRYDLWDELDSILKIISNTTDNLPKTNTALIKPSFSN